MASREDMTLSRFGRGTCPVCGRDIRLLKNGTIGRHGDKTSWPLKDCAGYTQEPGTTDSTRK